MNKPCVVANWKMNGSFKKNQELVTELLIEALQLGNLDTIDIFLSPPALYLEQVASLIKGSIFRLAAQNVYCESEGAFTGEISPAMLVDLGCSAVIIGHSERRRLMGETDELIARKFLAAYDNGLVPILCVGETEKEREQGKTLEVVRRQMKKVLALAGVSAFQTAMIAYEPVWAIGTGKAASPEDAEEVQAFIRSLLAIEDPSIAIKARILYGGSVNGNIAKGLFAKPDIDGGLVGGASLNAKDFLSICKAAVIRAISSQQN
jgi:triosephosphate isomerase